MARAISRLGHANPAVGATFDRGSRSIRQAIAARLKGPGGYYNIGNAIALTAGLAVQVTRSTGAGTQTLTDAVRGYFVGSPGATALTVATLVFFLSGEMYHRAWANGFPPDRRANWWGDVLSGIAAIVLTVALVYFGDLLLALLSGALLAFGKFGSAVFPGDRARTRCRYLVLLSRLPALATLALQIGRLVGAEAGPGALVMPLVMFGCYLIWGCADIRLLASERPVARPA